MADLFTLLSRASTSLGVQRAVSSTAANNIENANSAGYARQRADVAAGIGTLDGSAFLGGGAALLGINQLRDRFLEAQIPNALAGEARTSAEATALESFTALNNDSPGGLDTALSDFYAGLRSLAANPADPTLRQAAIQDASALVQSLHTTARAVDSARRALDEQAEGYVSEVNSLAAQVAALNVRIRAARASGAAPNDLLDARLKIQDRLAELTGATPVPDASGDLGLALPSGLALVSGDAAASISVEPDPATQGLLRFRIVRVDGSGPSVLPNSSFGGALGGVLDARDGALRRTAEGLDTLAFDLGTALNQVHAAGVGLDGSTGQAFFSLPADRHGAAFQIEVDPALLADPSKFAAAGPDDGLPGGASNLFALIATEEQPLSGGRSAIDAFASLVSSFGAETTRARAAADQTGALRSNLESLRESASGVSVDEEVIEMTKAQRAYEAISKVITTADEMLEKLLELR